MNFRDMCKQSGVNYNTARSYKRRHPELTNEEVILHYNPYCYYNIQGIFICVPAPEADISAEDEIAMSNMLDYLTKNDSVV